MKLKMWLFSSKADNKSIIEHMEALQAALQDGKSCLSCWS
jgi:hypothetical protein